MKFPSISRTRIRWGIAGLGVVSALGFLAWMRAHVRADVERERDLIAARAATEAAERRATDAIAEAECFRNEAEAARATAARQADLDAATARGNARRERSRRAGEELARMVEGGAPFDLEASAHLRTMERDAGFAP